MAGKACSGPSLRSALRPFYGRKRRPTLDCYCALDRSNRRPGNTRGAARDFGASRQNQGFAPSAQTLRRPLAASAPPPGIPRPPIRAKSFPKTKCNLKFLSVQPAHLATQQYNPLRIPPALPLFRNPTALLHSQLH